VNYLLHKLIGYALYATVINEFVLTLV